jgi:hypothetical protein
MESGQVFAYPPRRILGHVAETLSGRVGIIQFIGSQPLFHAFGRRALPNPIAVDRYTDARWTLHSEQYG